MKRILLIITVLVEISVFAQLPNQMNYVEASSNNTADSESYLPPSAEPDILVYTVSNKSAANGVVINEILASNDTTVMDEVGEFEDWIELYNTNSFDMDLSNFYLTDDTSSLDEWQFPSGTIISANGYLIIWCDKDANDGPLHSSFKISASGESVTFSNDTLGIIDQVFFNAQTTDMGYARVPNGTGPFVIQLPTFNSFNGNSTGINDLTTVSEFIVYPNPATNTLNIVFDQNVPNETIKIYSIVGELVFETQAKTSLQIDISNYQSGVYVIKYRQKFKKIIIE